MDDAHGDKLRVLVVDDIPDLALIFGKLLERLGCEVRTCIDPAADEFLQTALAFKPQLAFLDLIMPRVSGIDLARQLKSSDLPRFLLVATTGLDDRSTRQKCIDAGFDMVMLKPIGKEFLESLLIMARGIADGHATF